MPAKILVIEDNRANRELMLYLLNAFGHITVWAADGADGFEKARFESPDLIVCDIQLPRMDGYELAKRLKSHLTMQSVPLLAVTAFAMVGDRDRILAAGFDGYVPKPIDPETFVAHVDQYLPESQRSHGPTRNGDLAADAIDHVVGLHTILLVDNSPSNLSVLRSILEPSGYKTMAAENVSDALAMARKSRPHLILSDMHMPGADGHQLLRLFKSDPALAQIPLVIISSSGNRQTEMKAELDSGILHFIVRPIDPEKLLLEIANCLKAAGDPQHG